MDFHQAPDVLTASETRYSLAQRNTTGAKVGSFPVLLETLAKLWLTEPSELEWNASLVQPANHTAMMSVIINPLALRAGRSWPQGTPGNFRSQFIITASQVKV